MTSVLSIAQATPDAGVANATLTAAYVGALAAILAPAIVFALNLAAEGVRRNLAQATEAARLRERLLGRLSGIAASLGQLQYTRAHTRVLTALGARKAAEAREASLHHGEPMAAATEMARAEALSAEVLRLAGEGDMLLSEIVRLERELHEAFAEARILFKVGAETQARMEEIVSFERRDLSASVGLPPAAAEAETLADWQRNREAHLEQEARRRYEEPLEAIVAALRLQGVQRPNSTSKSSAERGTKTPAARRPRGLVTVLNGSLSLLSATLCLYVGIHRSWPVTGLWADAVLVASLPLLVIAVVLWIIGAWLGIRDEDNRPVWIALVSLLLFAPLGYLATFDQPGFMGALAGIFASLILAIAVMRKRDAII